MTTEDYAKIGKWVIDNLEKLMAGEHLGISVVCPIVVPKHGGICKIQIHMPTNMRWTNIFGSGDKEGWTKRDVIHYTWVPSEKAYVDDKFVFKMKQ